MISSGQSSDRMFDHAKSGSSDVQRGRVRRYLKSHEGEGEEEEDVGRGGGEEDDARSKE